MCGVWIGSPVSLEPCSREKDLSGEMVGLLLEIRKVVQLLQLHGFRQS
jgi:hypothetical protein